MFNNKFLPLLLCSFASLFLFSSCSMKPAVPSGFLGDYSHFKTVEEGKALSIEKNESKKLTDYTKMTIKPIVINFHPEAVGKKLPQEALDHLVEYFYNSLLDELKGSDWILVEGPGEGVVELRIAITDAAPNFQLLNLNAGSTLSGMGTGWAAMEAEFVDSVTQERILAMTDRRKGNRVVYFRGWSRWGHTRNVLDQWARLLISDSPYL